MGVTADYKAVLVQIARLGDLIQAWPLVCDLHREHGFGEVALVVDRELRQMAELMVPPEAVIDIPIKALLKTASTQSFSNIWYDVSGLADRLNRVRAERIINLNFHPPAAAIAMSIVGSNHLGARWLDVIENQPSDWIIEKLFNANTGLRRGNLHLSDLWRCYAESRSMASWQTLKLPPSILQKSDVLLQGIGIEDESKPIGVVVGANHDRRQWGLHNFGALISSTWKDDPVVLVGTRSEEPFAREIIDLVQEELPHGNVMSLCGLTDLPGLAGVLQRCRLVIGVDTGALHLAAAVGTVCLGIFFGSMNFQETGPYGEGHIVIIPDDMDYPCHENEMEYKTSGFGGTVPSEAVSEFLKGDNLMDSQVHNKVKILRSFMSESGVHWQDVTDSDEWISLEEEFCTGYSVM